MRQIFFALILLMTSLSFAQNSSEIKTAVPERADSNLMQVRIEPVYLLLKELRADFQFKLGEQFTLGPTVGYMSQGDGVYFGNMVANRFYYDDRTDRLSLGARADYYFNSFQEHSPYLSAFYRWSHSEVTSNGNSYNSYSNTKEKGNFDESAAGITGGYQWVWSNLFTLNVGGGASYFVLPDDVQLVDNDGQSYRHSLRSGQGLSYAIDVGLGLTF
jgi:hypothetical protein